jgi:hypothetical protein
LAEEANASEELSAELAEFVGLHLGSAWEVENLQAWEVGNLQVEIQAVKGPENQVEKVHQAVLVVLAVLAVHDVDGYVDMHGQALRANQMHYHCSDIHNVKCWTDSNPVHEVGAVA